MIKQFLFCLLLLWTVSSCNTDDGDFDIGKDFLDQKATIEMIDTFTVNLSTVKLDSITTDAPSYALVGRLSNDVMGTTNIQYYFNVNRATNYDNITDGDEDKDVDIFDSITVRLNYSHYYVGDTTKAMTLNLYHLTEELDFPDIASDEDAMYNTYSFPYDETSLGSYTFYPRPVYDDEIKPDTVEFRISDEIGEQIMSAVEEDGADVENDDNFREYMKGFMLKCGDNATSIIGFTRDSVRLRMYTHRDAVTKDERRYDFMLSNEGTDYNKPISDRSNTDFSTLQSLEQDDKILASDADNKSFIQGTAGIVTRLDFPSLSEIEGSETSVAFKATLELPITTDNNIDDLPSTLNFYSSDKANQMNSVLTSTSSSGTSSTLAATLVEDETHFSDSYYTVDITDWLLDELADYDSRDGVIVTIPTTNLYGTANYLILNNDKSNSDYKPKLKVYLMNYDKDDE